MRIVTALRAQLTEYERARSNYGWHAHRGHRLTNEIAQSIDQRGTQDRGWSAQSAGCGSALPAANWVR